MIDRNCSRSPVAPWVRVRAPLGEKCAGVYTCLGTREAVIVGGCD